MEGCEVRARLKFFDVKRDFGAHSLPHTHGLSSVIFSAGFVTCTDSATDVFLPAAAAPAPKAGHPGLVKGVGLLVKLGQEANGKAVVLRAVFDNLEGAPAETNVNQLLAMEQTVQLLLDQLCTWTEAADPDDAVVEQTIGELSGVMLQWGGDRVAARGLLWGVIQQLERWSHSGLWRGARVQEALYNLLVHCEAADLSAKQHSTVQLMKSSLDADGGEYAADESGEVRLKQYLFTKLN